MQILPAEHRVPLGVTVSVADALGIAGLGGGATGYYQDGEKRYRVLALVRADDAAAGDVLATLKKVDHATNIMITLK